MNILISPEINNYFNSLKPEALKILIKLRQELLKTFPDATESISYGVLSLSGKKHFIYYGAFKNHLSIFPPLTSNSKLSLITKKYKNNKGNLIFKYYEKIPYSLIVRVAKELKKQYDK